MAFPGTSEAQQHPLKNKSASHFREQEHFFVCTMHVMSTQVDVSARVVLTYFDSLHRADFVRRIRPIIECCLGKTSRTNAMARVGPAGIMGVSHDSLIKPQTEEAQIWGAFRHIVQESGCSVNYFFCNSSLLSVSCCHCC